MDYIVSGALFYTLISSALCLPFFFKQEKKWGLFILFLATVFILEIILKAGGTYLNFGLHYNWSGKILETAFVLGIMFFLNRRKQSFDFGLTLKQQKGSLKPVMILLTAYCLAESLFVYLYFGHADISVENYLFQATLPGISEEIIYRGFYLGVLNQIFPRKKHVLNVQVGYGAIVVTILFALVHGMDISRHFEIVFHPLNMVIPFLFGVVVVWVREKTGSVLIPVIFHNITNVLGALIMHLK